jgi:PhnB protein
MKLNPYLSFNDECEAAFKFYEQCLGGKIDSMMTYGDSPMAEQTPPEKLDKIMHASLMVGDTVLMGSDAPPQFFEKPQGFSVSLVFDDAVEAERIFNALAENGTVQMPIQETFWAARFGMVVDRFGTPWMINCDLPA